MYIQNNLKYMYESEFGTYSIYAKASKNAHAQVSSKARGLNLV